MRTLRRDSLSSGRLLLRAVASFWDETDCTVWRFGIADKMVLSSAECKMLKMHVQVTSFALFDWRVPMKCQCVSGGN